MTIPPSPTDWDTSKLCKERRTYLEQGLTFEQICDRITANMKVNAACVEPYRDGPKGQKDGRQIIFRVETESEEIDLFYNAPDGLRGRYWQSPDLGFQATQYVIRRLISKLLQYVEQNPPRQEKIKPPMMCHDMRASLEASSAKVWVRERDDDGSFLLQQEQPEKQLKVLRWETNENEASQNKGLWRMKPVGNELEIKGAILGRNGEEYIPKGKRDRSCQIHQYGFT